MNNTKEKILHTALVLFNDYGLSQVTLRTIAKKMGISQGNVTYHFQKREDIIEALYFQLVASIDTSIKSIDKTDNTLQFLATLSQNIMASFYQYRFFMLDFVQIIRENKKIKTHFKELSIQREHQFLMIFDELVKTGLMRQEILPNEYKNLYKRIQVYGDFWISDAQNNHTNLSKRLLHNYSITLLQSIFPYLTPKGQREYQSVLI